MPSIDTVITKGWSDGRKAHVKPVGIEIANRFGPLYFMWGPGREGTNGDHGKGLAIDFSILDKGTGPVSTWVDRPGPARPVLGTQIAEYLRADHERLNLTYVIWNRRIASAASLPDWTWRRYTGTNPHTDHVHASFETTGVYVPPAEDWLMGAREDILAAISSLRLGIDREMSAFAARLTALENIAGQIPTKVWDEKLSPDPKSPYHLAARTAQIGTMGKLDDAKRRDLAELQRDLEADADRMRIEEAVTEGDGEEAPTPPPPSA